MHVVFDNGIKIFKRKGLGKRSVESVNFDAYFYVPEEEIVKALPCIKGVEYGFTSIFGEKLKKIIVTSPSDVRMLRDTFSKTFEDDILIVDRFLIDHPELIDAAEKIRYQIVDIECDSLNEFPRADEARLPIVSICCYDNFLDTYVLFVWREDFIREKKKLEINNLTLTVHFYGSEQAMLRDYIKFTQVTDPDLLLGWNGVRFDGQYLINRMKNLNIDYTKLSPVNKVYLDDKFKNLIIHIGARTFIDVMELYERMQNLVYNWSIFGLESYSLDNVAQAELGFAKATHENPGKMWREDVNNLLYYNYYDVYLVKCILDKLQLIDLLNELRCRTRCSWDAVMSAGKYMDFFVLNYCRNKDIVLPSKRKVMAEKYEGAVVFDPVPGLMKNVIDMDLKSLYPSIIMNFNISPEVMLDKNCDKDCIDINGVKFDIGRKGIIPNIVESIYKERMVMKSELKQIAKKYGIRSNEYHVMNIKQTILKLIINIMYGIFAYSKFRLYNTDVSKSITYVGRAMINYVKDVVEKEGYKVVYGDTDSVYIKVSDKLSADELKQLAFSLHSKINNSFDDFAKRFNKNLVNRSLLINGQEKKLLEIELDKIYRSILFVEAKKKYVGKVIYSNDRDCDELQLVGFELKRRDTPRFAKNILLGVYDKILNFEDRDSVCDFIRKEIKKITNASVDDIGITIRLGKDLDEYYTNTQHSRGAKYSQQYLKKSFSRLDYIKIIFVKSVPKGFPKTDVICLAEGDSFPEGFEIDIDRTISRLIEMKLEAIFNVLRWDFNEVKGQRRLM